MVHALQMETIFSREIHSPQKGSSDLRGIPTYRICFPVILHSVRREMDNKGSSRGCSLHYSTCLERVSCDCQDARGAKSSSLGVQRKVFS
jgi:hypothetical protein